MTLTTSNAEAAQLLNRGDEIYSIHEDDMQKLQRLTVETAMYDDINPIIPVYVVTHESNWDPTAVGDHGLAFGPAQFHQETFDIMRKNANMPKLQYKSSHDQIILMEWALNHKGGPQWTTYRKLEGIK